MDMKIIIPAKQLNSREFSTDVVVDNKYTKVKCQQYIVTKTSLADEEGNPIVVSSDSVQAVNTFNSENHSVNNSFFVDECKRVETYYTTGTIEITTTKNIYKTTSTYPLVTGKLKKGRFLGTFDTSNPNWTTENPADFGNLADITSQTDFSQTLDAPKTYGITLPNESYFRVDSFIVSAENTKITLSYKVLTKTRTYHRKQSGSYLELFNDIVFWEGETFTINLSIEEISVEEDEDTISTFGEGADVYTIESNELYQKVNTYNNQISMAEYNSNEIIKRFKNGAKTTNFTIKTSNLKTEEGYTLEKQVVSPKDELIPYYINKYNMEVPFCSNDQQQAMVFVANSNEVNYDKIITQTISATEKTYFDLTMPDELVATRNSIEIYNSSRIYKNETITFRLSPDVASDLTPNNTCVSINNSGYAPFINNVVTYIVGEDTNISLFVMSNELTTELSVDNYILTNTSYSSSNGEGFIVTTTADNISYYNIVGEYATDSSTNPGEVLISKIYQRVAVDSDFVEAFDMPSSWSCFTLQTPTFAKSKIYSYKNTTSGTYHNFSWKIENGKFYYKNLAVSTFIYIIVYDYKTFTLSIENVQGTSMKELKIGDKKDMKLEASLNKSTGSQNYDNLSFTFFNGSSEKFVEIKIKRLNKVGSEIG